MGSYFDEAAKKAFPPAPPYKAYKWPAFSRDVSTTKLETSAYSPAGPGTRVPIPVRTVTTMGLVTTYRFVAVAVKKPKNPTASVGVAPGGVAVPNVGLRSFDPHGDFTFRVEIEGLDQITFQKFDGIEVEIDQIEFRESMDPHMHKRPGLPHYANLKLTQGVVGGTKLWDWLQGVIAGKVQRRNGSIHVMTDSGEDAGITYNFYQAWPCKWAGLRLDGKGTGVLVEELELAIDSIARA